MRTLIWVLAVRICPHNQVHIYRVLPLWDFIRPASLRLQYPFILVSKQIDYKQNLGDGNAYLWYQKIRKTEITWPNLGTIKPIIVSITICWTNRTVEGSPLRRLSQLQQTFFFFFFFISSFQRIYCLTFHVKRLSVKYQIFFLLSKVNKKKFRISSANFCS